MGGHWLGVFLTEGPCPLPEQQEELNLIPSCRPVLLFFLSPAPCGRRQAGLASGHGRPSVWLVQNTTKPSKVHPFWDQRQCHSDEGRPAVFCQLPEKAFIVNAGIIFTKKVEMTVD